MAQKQSHLLVALFCSSAFVLSVSRWVESAVLSNAVNSIVSVFRAKFKTSDAQIPSEEIRGSESIKLWMGSVFNCDYRDRPNENECLDSN